MGTSNSLRDRVASRLSGQQEETQGNLRSRVENRLTTQSQEAAQAQREQEKSARSYVANTIPSSSDYLNFTNNMTRAAQESDPLMQLAMETVKRQNGNGYVSVADLNRVDTSTPEMTHSSGKFPAMSSADIESEANKNARMAAAFTPTADMYLNPYTAAAADEMQKIADQATAEAGRYNDLQEELYGDLNRQRNITNKAFRTANAFMPWEGGSPEAWDQYNALYDEAAAEDAKLRAMGGAANRTILPAALGSEGAGFVNAGATVLDFANRYGYYTDENDWMGKNPESKTVTELHAVADELQNRSAQNLEGVKAGRGRMGNTFVNTAVSGIQMIGDAIANMIAPGSGLALLGARAFGNSAQDARFRGANTAQQLGYGAAVAAVEVISEKLFDGLAGIYGKGAADKVVEQIISKLTTSEGGQRALTWLASGLLEMGEEWFSGAIDPALESIFDNEKIFSSAHYNKDTLSDMIEDGFVGFLLGSAGGTVEAVGNIAANVNTNARTVAKPETAQAVETSPEVRAEETEIGNDTLYQMAQEMAKQEMGEAPAQEHTETVGQFEMQVVETDAGGYGVQVKNNATGEVNTIGNVPTQDAAQEMLTEYKSALEQTVTTQYNDTKATKEATANGREDILSRSGQRNDGQGSGEQAARVEEAAGRDQSRNESGQNAEARPADGGASDLTVGEAVSTAGLGIENGSTTDTLYRVTDGDTEYTKEARRIAQERGLNLVLFKGGNLQLNGAGEARGFIDGKNVYVRADHPLFTADKIMLHETGHDMIAKGEIDLDTVRDRVAQVYGKDGTKTVAELYASAYEGMTADEAWEELVCDSIANMNIFSGTLDSISEKYQSVLNDVKEATKDSNTQQQRGPPSAESKTSREENKGWKPKLTKSEWSVAERAIQNYEGEDYNAGARYALKSEKGDKVFVIYSTTDDATMLFANSGKDATIAYEFTELWKKGEIGFDAAAGRLDADIKKSGRSVLSGNGNNSVSQDRRGTIGTGTVLSGQSGGQTKRGGNRGKSARDSEFDALKSTLENLDKQASRQGKASREESESRYSREANNLNELQKQNESLKERVEYWKGQTKRTEVPTARADDAAKVGRSLAKDYDSKADTKEIGQDVKALADKLIQGADWSEIKDGAYGIARKIVNNAQTMREGDGTYNEVRDALKRPIIISQQDAHDVSPEWGAWRNANLSKVNVSINGKGTPVDTVYAELSERFPSLFPEDITRPADQLQRMAEIMDEMAPVYENPYSYDMETAIEYCANDIIDRVLGEDVRQTPPTFADKAAARLAAEKARNAEKTREALQRVRTQRDEKIAALKQHYADVKKAAAERKADSAARTKLLKIARRLNNKKLPAVSRALLNEYIGDLDLISKSITGQTLENLATLRDWYESLSDKSSPNYDPDFLSDPATEERIKRLSKKHIGDMTSEEVAELTEALLNIENELRTEKKTIDTEDKRDTYMQGLQAIDDVENSKGSKKGVIDKYIVTESLAPTRQMHRITGYNDDDPLYQRTQELADGQRKMFDYQRRANAKFQKYLDDKNFIKRITGKDATWIKIRGIGENGKTVDVEITPAMRMSLYLHSLNDQNLKHIRDGGITVPDKARYIKGQIADAYAEGQTVKLTPSAVRSVISGMTEQERAFANAAHRYFNGMSRDEINAVSEKLKGYSIAQVENYFPINTDTAFTKSDFESLKFDGTLDGMGFLKERINNAANPIMLRDMNDVLNQSINQHSKYVGLAIPVRNFNKVWGVTKSSFNEDGTRNGYESSVQKKVAQKWGKDAVDYVEKMMKDLQNTGGKTENWDKALNKIRSNYAQAVLTLNASVALKQAASYPTAAAVIGFKPLARAMADFGRVDLDKIAQYTPLQWYRSQGYSSQELGDMAKRGMKLPAALNWVQGMDVLTTRKLWKSAEYYVRQNQIGLQVGSDEYYKAVADVYNQIIEETQPNYTTMQRPQLLRSDSTMIQNLAMFKTQPFQNFNILYDAFGNLEAKRNAYMNTGTAEAKAAYQNAQKRAVWAVSSQLVAMAVFAAMTAAWAGVRGKDDKYRDDEVNLTGTSFLKGIGKDMLSSTFGMVPFGSDVYELAASLAFKDKYYGMDAVTPSAITDFFKSINTAGTTISKMIETVRDPDKSVDWNEMRLKMDGVIKNAAKVAGIPVENVENLFNAAYRQVARRATGFYEGEYAYLRLTTSPESNSTAYYDNLYRAYNDNPEAFMQIKNDMVASGDFDNDDIKNAMETRMKKAQGVDSVKDLDQRYMEPAQRAEYDSVMGDVQKSSIYGKANADQLAALESAMYDYAVQNSDGQTTQAKIEGGAAVGLDAKEYFEYVLALKVVDTPNSNGEYGGTPTNEEAKNAINMIDALTDAERTYLWMLTHDSGKNNPWDDGKNASQGYEAATDYKVQAKETAEAKKEEKSNTADVSKSSAISAASYDPKTQTVSITYKSTGKTYTYDGVTQSEWDAFKAADSKGSYVSKNWK